MLKQAAAKPLTLSASGAIPFSNAIAAFAKATARLGSGRSATLNTGEMLTPRIVLET